MENVFSVDERKTYVDICKLPIDSFAYYCDDKLSNVNVFQIEFYFSDLDSLTQLFSFMRGYYLGYIIQTSTDDFAKVTFICHCGYRSFFKRLNKVVFDLGKMYSKFFYIV